jgi:membrane protein required for colicin V production
MTWLDIVIGAVILVSAIWGLSSGMVKILFSLGGVILGAVVAGKYYSRLATSIFDSSSEEANIASFLIILLGITAVGFILGGLAKKALPSLLLGGWDKFWGMVLGGGGGAVLCGAILAAIITQFSSTQETIGESYLASLVLDKFPVVLSLLPEEFDSVRDIFEASPVEKGQVCGVSPG